MAESAVATKTSSDKAPAAPQPAAPEKVRAGGPTMQGMSPQEMQQRFGNAGTAAFMSGDAYGGRDAELRLPAGLANTFEQRFGQPVDHARIKVGPSANRRVVRYGKSAVTIGDVIYFRTGSFRPETIEGLALLAHELVHVIHQTGDRSQLTPGTEAEAEAEAEKLSLPSSDSTERVSPRWSDAT